MYDDINPITLKSLLIRKNMNQKIKYTPEKLSSEILKIKIDDQYVEHRLSIIENIFINKLKGIINFKADELFNLKNKHLRFDLMVFFLLLNNRKPNNLAKIDSMDDNTIRRKYGIPSNYKNIHEVRSSLKILSLFTLREPEKSIILEIVNSWNFTLCKSGDDSEFIFGENSISDFQITNELIFPISSNYAILIQKYTQSKNNIYHPIYLSTNYALLNGNEVALSNHNQALKNDNGVLVGNRIELQETLTVKRLIEQFYTLNKKSL